MIGKPSRALKPDAQAFDEVRITTVPRYKTSGLSGDEWRISAQIEFMRNGEVFHTEIMQDVAHACYALGWLHMEACSQGKAFFAGEGLFCDQEGCSAPALLSEKHLKKDYCRQCGTDSGREPKCYRRFCSKHQRRGDCGLNDADANYE